MAKRGGFPGGGMPGNMANLMKQAQKMQRQMEAQAKEKALKVAKIIKLDDKLDLFAGKLGLLDRKRLEIGRALATEPKILLLDEVGGGLTESEVGLIINLVKEIKREGVSVIWIEHIIRTMLEGTDRVMLLAYLRSSSCHQENHL